jgi:calcineurin-like phosphoesterase family protein
MSNVWFTSDLHLGHRLVSGKRGFVLSNGDPDTKAHDHAILSNWARTVGPNDQVWVLGDLAVASSRERVASVLATIATLPGSKHLIVGNHDPAHPLHKDAHTWQKLYFTAFESVQAFAKRSMSFHRRPNEPVLLSHFPYEADGDHRTEARYREFRLPDSGYRLIHGHTHSAVRMTSVRELHVGLDAWDLRPVHLDEVIEQFETYGRGYQKQA